MERFSRWSEHPDEAPGGAAVVQVKVLGELLDYPSGKSAMVWYGVLADCTAAELRVVLDQLSETFASRSLVWRHLVAERPEARLGELLARFEDRFGAPPGDVRGA
jgi:hypothetical protein